MVLGKPEVGDDWIALGGSGNVYHGMSQGEIEELEGVAGYRYCRKAEDVTEAPEVLPPVRYTNHARRQQVLPHVCRKTLTE